MKNIFGWILWIILMGTNLWVFYINKDAFALIGFCQLMFYSWVYYVFYLNIYEKVQNK